MTRPLLLNRAQLVLSLFCFEFAFITIIFGFVDPQLLNVDSALFVLVALCSAILGLLLIAYLWFKHVEGHLTVWLHAPILIIGWVVVAFCVPGVVSFTRPEWVSNLQDLSVLDYTAVPLGFALILVGLICILFGYILGIRTFQPLGIALELGKPIPTIFPVLLLYLVTVILRIIRVLVTGVAYGADNNALGSFLPFNQWLDYIEVSRYLALSLLTIHMIRNKWPKLPLFLAIMTELLYGFSSGLIKPIFFTGIVIALSALYAGAKLPNRRLLPSRYTPFILVLLIAGIFVIPVTESLRPILNEGRFDSRSPIEVSSAVREAIGESWGRGFDVAWNMLTNKMMRRQAAVAHAPGIIIARTPEDIPYRGIEELLMTPAYIVPRILWTNKPTLSTGVSFSKTYLNMPDDTRSSSAMTIVGEGYIFAGWSGTIIASLSLGLLLALLFRNTVSAGLTPIYLSLMPVFTNFEGQFTTMAIYLVQQTVILLIIYWLLTHTFRVMKEPNGPSRAGC